MRRRDVLAGFGAGVGIPTAGCLSAACRPSDDPLGNIDYTQHADGDEFVVRGTVLLHFLLDILVSDGTGKARIGAANSYEIIDQELVEVGDCMEATATLDMEQSVRHDMTVLGVTDVELLGKSKADVQPVEDYPSPKFDIDQEYDIDTEVWRGEIVVSHGDGVVANNLFVVWNGEERGTWADLVSSVAPSETIPDGSAYRFEVTEDVDVMMLWRSPDRTWSHKVKGLGFSGPR